MKRSLLVLALFCLILSANFSPKPSVAQTPPNLIRVLIDLQGPVTTSDRSLISNAGGRFNFQLSTSNTISIAIPSSSISALQQYAGRFANIRVDPTMRAAEDSIDWGVDKIDAEKAWGNAEDAVTVVPGRPTGNGVKVAIIDTGIDRDHPDLAPNIVTGRNFITGAPDPNNFEDDNGHGTHVAGTLAAADNGSGLIGVAPEADLYILKALGSDGLGTASDITRAIEWASGLNGGTKVDVINMSLGGSVDDDILHRAIDNAYGNLGIVVVVAAGNGGPGSDSVWYPGQNPNAFTVAATDANNVIADFSSRGSAVDVAAPRLNILSTYLDGTTKVLSGTSMAAPHVAGLVALVKSANPALSAAQLQGDIESTATDAGAPRKDSVYGSGVINAAAAVAARNPLPVAPVNTTTGNFLPCGAQPVVTSSAGDNNGFETTPENACQMGGGAAVDADTGTGPDASCSSPQRDRHVFSNFNVNNLDAGAAVTGIEVRLAASVESTAAVRALCVDLSSDGGATWSAFRRTGQLSTTTGTIDLGLKNDTWGRSWVPADFANANFRLRITSAASDTTGDISLDYVSMRVWAVPGTAPPPDVTPPTVQSTTPASGATNVPTNVVPTAIFTEPIPASAIHGSSFTLRPTAGGANIYGSASYQSGFASFSPAVALASGTEYTATIANTVRDFAGNAMLAAYTWSFRTAVDSTLPQVISVTPSNNATNLPTDATTVVVTFSEPMNTSTITTSSFRVADAGDFSLAGTFKTTGNTTTFTPATTLTGNMTYKVTLSTAIRDLAGNSLNQETVSLFTTQQAFLSCSAQSPLNTASGDNNGFQSGPGLACSDGGGMALDTDSGTGTSTSCTASQKDRHVYYNYNANVDSSATIKGLEVRVDARADSTSGDPRLCVELSWNGGTTWTAAKQSPTLSTSEATYILGTSTDTWGRSWIPGNLSNTNFRIRVTSVASNTSRDFSLDWVALRVTTTGGPPPPSDVTRPALSTISPAHQTTGVPIGSNVTATFSEPVNSATVNTSSFSLSPANGGFTVQAAVSVSGSTATLNPYADLAPNTTYEANIAGTITDLAGNAMTTSHSWTFTTVGSAQDTQKPSVKQQWPANGATGISTGSPISATFSEPMNPTSVTAPGRFTVKTTSGNVNVPGTVTYSADTATFTPSSPLAANTSYTVTLSTQMTDMAGNALTLPGAWSFTSALPGPLDTIKPTVTTLSPSSGATNASTGSTVRATFSEAMNPTGVTTSGRFTVKTTSGGTNVPGTVTYSNNVATFTPTSALAASTSYTMTLSTLMTDVAGNALTLPSTWTFRTAPVVTTCAAPTITSHTDSSPSGGGNVSFNWTTVPGATSYRIEPQSGFFTYSTVTTTSATSFSGVDGTNPVDPTWRISVSAGSCTVTGASTSFNP